MHMDDRRVCNEERDGSAMREKRRKERKQMAKRNYIGSGNTPSIKEKDPPIRPRQRGLTRKASPSLPRSLAHKSYTLFF